MNAAINAETPPQEYSALQVAHAIGVLAPFIGSSQLAAVRVFLRGEERGFFAGKLIELAETIAKMPKTYDQDGKGDQAVAYLHYFYRGADWYIMEKDSDPDGEGQLQAFGLADLGLGFPELGYISIPEVLSVGAKIDFHFTPKTIGEVRREKYGAA
jgi:hypothetical protein